MKARHNPVLQVALDFVELRRALKVGQEAVKGGADWLEAGTPLIKSEGMQAIRQLRKAFPRHILVADMKTMDVGRTEVEMAAKSGANIVEILGLASEATIKECIQAAKNYGAEILVDLLEVKEIEKRAKEIEAWGANYIGVHTPIDAQMLGKDPFGSLRKISKLVNIPLAVAGGINSETASRAIKNGASILIVGGAIIKSRDVKKATQIIKKAIESGKIIKTKLYKRVGAGQVRKILARVSTANISDALHRGGYLKGIVSRVQNIKMAGPAVTVRTYPGDWAKPVEAIDLAKPGEVIVIDAGAVGPAVWGELATESCVRKKISGVVIEGALRDTGEIRKLKFPAFSRLISAAAGEPKGLGEINVPITVSGIKLFPGDWIVGDEDGVVVIPGEKIVEISNRAMDVLETENRIREEIRKGETLSSVMALLKWEKK